MGPDRAAKVHTLSRPQLQERLAEIFEFRPHEEQIEAIDHLINCREDLILIAKTGWGKSMVFQSIPLFRSSKNICLMIMPLSLLEEDQARGINAIQGCAACVLNAATNSESLRQKIKNGEYTHVLTSPEIALHKNFLPILHHEPFLNRLALVGIDELHVVQQWGESFRPNYSQLQVLRARVGPTVPWFGTSATLDPAMLQAVKVSAGFSTDVRVIHTDIDRSDLFYNLQQIERPVTSYQDLYFVTQPTLLSKSGPGANRAIDAIDLPKTVIYCDRISEILAIVRQLRLWIKIGEAFEIVMPYHSELSEKMKAQISKEFIRPNSKHRIIVATDAMGMGMNNPDIARVVNWKQPSSLCALMQRAGRAARSSNMTGEFIWFIEPWCFYKVVGGPYVGPQSQPSLKQRKRRATHLNAPLEGESDSGSAQSDNDLPTNQSQRKSLKSDQQRQGALPPGMLKVINGSCARREIVDFFGQSFSESPVRCCSKCNPGNAKIHRPGNLKPGPRLLTKEDAWAPTWKKTRVKKALAQWRKIAASTHFADSILDPVALEKALQPKVMNGWVDHCTEMTSVEGFRKWASGWDWVEYGSFAEELAEIIHDAVEPSYLTRREPLQPADSNRLPPFTPTSLLKKPRLEGNK